MLVLVGEGLKLCLAQGVTSFEERAHAKTGNPGA